MRRRGGNPNPDGAPVKAVIKRMGKRWFATVCYKVNALAKPDDGSAIGVDMNVRQVADSTGEIHQMPDLARLEAKHKRHHAAWRARRRAANGASAPSARSHVQRVG